jgi:tetratricopeptide (TPR) repeat protein
MSSSILAELQELANEYRSDPVRASVELLAAELAPEVRRSLKLAAIPHYFTEDILCAMDSELAREAANAACAKLVETSLAAGLPEGFKLHDQVRAVFFADWLKPDRDAEFRELSGRLVEYFRILIDDSDDSLAIRRHLLFHEIGRDQVAGFALFENEFKLARRQFRPSDCAAMLALVHEYDAVLEPAIAMRLCYQEGKHAADLREFGEAEKQFTMVVDNPATPGDIRIKALQRLGSVFRQQRKLDQAVMSYTAALEQARTTPGKQDDARSMHWLAAALSERGEFEKAEELLNESIKLESEAGDVLRIAQSKNALGILYLRKQEADRAAKAFTEALHLLTESDAKSAQLLHNLGSAYFSLPEFELSKFYFQLSLEQKKKTGDVGGQALTLNNLAPVLDVLGERDDAIEAARKSVELFESIHDFEDAAHASRNLARFYRKRRSHEKRHRRRPLVELHQSAAQRDEREAFERAIALYRRAGNEEEAASVAREINPSRRATRVPWWAWLSIAVATAIVLFLVYLIWLLAGGSLG